MAALCTVVGPDLSADCEAEARKRLGAHEQEDWPIIAAALALECPLWTEDTGFFGCGVATGTSANLGIFLDQDPSPLPPLNEAIAVKTETESTARPSS